MGARVQTGDVIFYRPVGIIGKLICKLTKSEYSHVALALDEHTIIEANRFIKTRMSPFELIDEVHSVHRLTDITEELQNRIAAYAWVFQGSHYDYLQIIKILFRVCFNRELTLVNETNKVICSEVIDLSFLGAGVERKDGNNIGSITPQELFEKYTLEKVI